MVISTGTTKLLQPTGAAEAQKSFISRRNSYLYWKKSGGHSEDGAK